MSKTVIIGFEQMFELFALRSKLNSLINVCSDFDATDLHLLPQPLEIVKMHDSYRSDINSLKKTVHELYES